MQVGNRVRLSEYGENYLDWPHTYVEGVVEGKYSQEGDFHYDVWVQWDNDTEGNTTAHYENELEVVL